MYIHLVRKETHNMNKTKINFNKETRSIEVHFTSLSQSLIAQELVDLISIACNYNANFSYSYDRQLFSAQCANFIVAEEIYRAYREYFLEK